MKQLIPCVVGLLGGCPLVDVQVEVSEVCVTEREIAMAGAPGQAALDQNFTFADLGAVHQLLQLDGSLHFVRAEVRATSGLASLDFVQQGQVTIASGDPSSTLPTLDAYDCAGDCLADGPVLPLTPTTQANILAYLATDNLAGHVGLTGPLPSTAWTAAVTVCVEGTLSRAISP